jgi:hypothetical protein
MCPVCCYSGFAGPAYEADAPTFALCPCCGTEFGFDDDPSACGIDHVTSHAGKHDPRDPEYRAMAHATLRARWQHGGMRWWSTTEPAPEGWDAWAQVAAMKRG